MSDKPLTLPLLLAELKEITDWRPLGMYLHVPRSKLNAIEAQYFQSQGIGRCKEEVLSAWLRRNPDASWNEIVNALKLIDEQALASRLKKKYLQSAIDDKLPNYFQPDLDAPADAPGTGIFQLCLVMKRTLLLTLNYLFHCPGILLTVAVATIVFQSLHYTPPVNAPSSANPIPSGNVPTSANPIPSVTVPTSANPIPSVDPIRIPSSNNLIPSINSLISELPPISDPLDFCRCLGVPSSECQDIHSNYRRVRRQATLMAATWFSQSKNPSWDKLVAALFCHQRPRVAIQLAERKGVNWRPLQYR